MRDLKSAFTKNHTVVDVSATDFFKKSRGSSITSARENKSRKVRFCQVRVHTHHVTVGDNPSVSSGLPIALEWDPVRSDRYEIDDLEELERLYGDQPAKAVVRVSSRTREQWLRDNGHSSESFRLVIQDIETTKAAREASRIESEKEHCTNEQHDEIKCPPIEAHAAPCPNCPDKAPKLPCRRVSDDLPLEVKEDSRRKDFKHMSRRKSNKSFGRISSSFLSLLNRTPKN